MPISVYPAPVAASSVSAVAAVPGAAIKQYSITRTFSPGVYVITVSDGTAAFVEFFNSTTSVLKTTAQPSVTISLATECTGAIITLLTSSSASVQINQTANTLVSNEISGTLDTITASGTYSQTGKLYVLCVGGGGGGSASSSTDVGTGGMGATIEGKIIFTSSPTTVTVGAKGVGNVESGGTAGGTTSFGAFLSAAGGAAGIYAGYTAPVRNSINYWSSIITGDTGQGGTAGNGSNAAKQGIITGGALGTPGLAGTSAARTGQNATGYGQGGGAAYNDSGTGTRRGGDGSPGVIYVLRGF